MTAFDEKPTLSTPRMQGIYEQYRRAKRFIRLARRCKKPVARFTNLIAAIYPARAIVELMLEAVEKQEIASFQNEKPKLSRDKFEEKLAPKLPYYYLLEKILV